MMFKRVIISIIATICLKANAYIDTTSKSFKKPKPLVAHSYKYKESKVDRFMDSAADKLGGTVLGTVITGPIGLILKVSDKVIKHQEGKQSQSIQ